MCDTRQGIQTRITYRRVFYHDFVKVNFYNKDNFIILSQGYSDVVAPGAGGSDPADRRIL